MKILSLQDTVDRELENLLDDDSKVLLAYSGGSDSAVLLDLLQKSPQMKNHELILGHVNHHLRSQSNAEASEIRDLAKRKEMKAYIADFHKKKAAGVEDEARVFRYKFFSKVMQENDIKYLMTAHHTNDQAETVLMRLVKSGSLFGLTGISKERSFTKGKLLRPLIDITDAKLQAYASSHKINYFVDKSNDDLSYERNYIRHKVIPMLEERNHNVVNHLSQFSKNLEDVLTDYQQLISAELVSTKSARGWPLELLEKANDTKIKIMLEILTKNEINLSVGIIKEIRKMASGQHPNWKLQVSNNFQLVSSYGYWKAEGIQSSSNVTIPEILSIDENETTINLGKGKLFHGNPSEETASQTVWLSEKDFPLIISRVRPGDRIAIEHGHSKKLSRIMIDLKIPQSEREKLWVLRTSDGTVIAFDKIRTSQLFCNNKTGKMTYKFIFL